MKVLLVVSIVLAAVAVHSQAKPQYSGKYEGSGYQDGRYRPDEGGKPGQYMHMPHPYMHTHDSRELGVYHHVYNPYGGGYGPYFGLQMPYIMDNGGQWVPPPTTTTQKPTTTRATTTTTTTTTTPRSILFNYNDEGGWKILKQKEEKSKKKYDFLYLTENGIYGEERAHVKHGHGTQSMGYYEYTGDDGKIYRVDYSGGKGGFMPMGDHIPTPPPIPDAIRKALEYVEKKRNMNPGLQHNTGEYRPQMQSAAFRTAAPLRAPATLQTPQPQPQYTAPPAPLAAPPTAAFPARTIQPQQFTTIQEPVQSTYPVDEMMFSDQPQSQSQEAFQPMYEEQPSTVAPQLRETDMMQYEQSQDGSPAPIVSDVAESSLPQDDRSAQFVEPGPTAEYQS